MHAACREGIELESWMIYLSVQFGCEIGLSNVVLEGGRGVLPSSVGHIAGAPFQGDKNVL